MQSEPTIAPITPEMVRALASSSPPDDDAAKNLAMIPKEHAVAGFALREMSAGALNYLKLTRNKLITLTGDAEQCKKQILAEEDGMLHVGGALYILSADPELVRKAMFTGNEGFYTRVMEYIEPIPLGDFDAITTEIIHILQRAFVGQDYTTKTEAASRSPNSPPPRG